MSRWGGIEKAVSQVSMFVRRLRLSCEVVIPSGGGGGGSVIRLI